MQRDGKTVIHEQRHSWIVRLTHWLTAASIVIMIMSGWRIYNNDPIFPFVFPLWLTLGGDPDVSYSIHSEAGMASAIRWHFAGMWLLVLSFLSYVGYGLASGHFRRDFLPLSSAAFVRDFAAALKFRLAHQLGTYNAVQKLFYWGVLFAISMMILSGLAIWKPVQFHGLVSLMGGFDFARVVHFFFMVGIVAFLCVHIALVALVPKTLVAMLTGRAGEMVRAEPAAAPGEQA